jgi:hypothetical protein
MSENTINWEAIRRDRDQGMSLRTLAIKYGISKSYIGEMLSSGQSGQSGQHQNTTSSRTPPTPSPETSPPINLSTVIAQNFIRMIAKHATGKFTPNDVKLDPKDMKLLADTLSQCNKIIVMAEYGGEQENPQEFDVSLMRYMSDEDLDQFEGILERARTRKQEAEGNVTPIRRQA